VAVSCAVRAPGGGIRPATVLEYDSVSGIPGNESVNGPTQLSSRGAVSGSLDLSEEKVQKNLYESS
jgi:hypothetical protein